MEDALNTEFMGFKMWHILILSLVSPSPVFMLILLFVIPEFKEKITGFVKNGLPGLASGFYERAREAGDLVTKGAPKDSSAS